MMRVRLLLVALALVVVGLPAAANSGSELIDPDPQAWVTNGPVYAIAHHGDRLYIGGRFTRVGPNYGPGIRLDLTTGAAAPPFPRIEGGNVVTSIADGGGGWFIGGDFTSAQGELRQGLAHLLPTGALDTAWVGPPIQGQVRAFLLSGSRLYVGGGFTTVGGTPHIDLVALESTTGAIDETWRAPDPQGGAVLALATKGARLFVGGQFTSMGGTPRNRLAAVALSDGTLDQAWRADMSYDVEALLATSERLYIATWDYFVVLNPDTAQLDPTWQGLQPDFGISRMALVGGRLVVAGPFEHIGNYSRSHLAAYNAVNGQLNPWNPNPDGYVSALDVTSSMLLVGGSFARIAGVGRDALAAFDTSTWQIDPGWNPGANSGSYTISVSGSYAYVGGPTSVGGATRRFVAALDASTGVVDPEWDPSPSSTVFDLAVANDRVYLSGEFVTVHGYQRRYLAAVDPETGAVDTTWRPRPNGLVSPMAL